MGVSCILLWDPPEGFNPTQALEFLQKRLETLGGRHLGTWTIDCETLQSTQILTGGGPPKLIHMIHSSEYPQTTFAVLDSMKCLVGENSLDTIFGNLRQFYNPKKGQKIEVKGFCYEAKGYVVKIGSIVIGSTNKGLIVEVEDRDKTDVASCWGPLTEFTRGLLDYSPHIDPPAFSQQTNRPYKPSDSMIHYAYTFKQLRRPMAVGAVGIQPAAAAGPPIPKATV